MDPILFRKHLSTNILVNVGKILKELSVTPCIYFFSIFLGEGDLPTLRRVIAKRQVSLNYYFFLNLKIQNSASFYCVGQIFSLNSQLKNYKIMQEKNIKNLNFYISIFSYN